MPRTCIIDGCSNIIKAHSFCSKHLYRWEQYGDPLVASFFQDGHKKNNLGLYRTWQRMKDRCYNKNCKQYSNYGGRGIKICARWLGANGFNNFFKDMGEKPSKKHSLDRIDPNGGYCPENCRWATWEEQENNRRINVYYEYNNMKLTLPQWSRMLNISYGTLLHRKKKGLVPPELFAPIDTRYSRRNSRM